MDMLKTIILRANIDTAEIDKFKKSINELSKVADGFKLSFLGATTGFVAGLAGVTIGIGKIVKSTADASMKYQKFALDTWMDNKSAKTLQTTIKAMGESVEDIAWIPELRKQYFELVNLGNEMQTPADAEQQLRYIRSIIFEFKKLKLEISYASEWITYYLIKYLSVPFAKAKQQIKNVNESLVQSMPEWTNVVARILSIIVMAGINFGRFIIDIKRTIDKFFTVFPDSMRKIGKFIALISLAFISNPVLATLASIVLLIDDLYAYIDGRKSLLPSVWSYLIYEWGKFQLELEAAKPKIKKLYIEWSKSIADAVKEFSKLNFEFELGKTRANVGDTLNNSVTAVGEASETVYDVYKDFVGILLLSLEKRGLIDQLKSTMSAVSESFKLITGIFKKIMVKLHIFSEGNMMKSFTSWFVDELATIIKNGLTLVEAGAHIISSILLFAVGDIAGGKKEAALAAAAIIKFAAGFTGKSSGKQSSGKTGLNIASGVEDADLSNTKQYIVDKVKALNDWAVDNFGKSIIVSGGWRSAENNASVGGAEGSYHLSGEAVDIDVSNFTYEERLQLFYEAGELGFNTDSDVIYHDRGSGYHMHLQPAAGNVIDTSADLSRSYTVAPLGYTPANNIKRLGTLDFNFAGDNVTPIDVREAVATSVKGVCEC